MNAYVLEWQRGIRLVYNLNTQFAQLLFVVSECCVSLFILPHVFIVFCGIQPCFLFLSVHVFFSTCHINGNIKTWTNEVPRWTSDPVDRWIYKWVIQWRSGQVNKWQVTQWTVDSRHVTQCLVTLNMWPSGQLILWPCGPVDRWLYEWVTQWRSDLVGKWINEELTQLTSDPNAWWLWTCDPVDRWLYGIVTQRTGDFMDEWLSEEVT